MSVQKRISELNAALGIEKQAGKQDLAKMLVSQGTKSGQKAMAKAPDILAALKKATGKGAKAIPKGKLGAGLLGAAGGAGAVGSQFGAAKEEAVESEKDRIFESLQQTLPEKIQQAYAFGMKRGFVLGQQHAGGSEETYEEE